MNLVFNHVHGHCWILQVSVLEDEPEQPLLAVGFMQVLVAERSPPPQVTEHAVHSLHGPQPGQGKSLHTCSETSTFLHKRFIMSLTVDRQTISATMESVGYALTIVSTAELDSGQAFRVGFGR